MPNLEQEKKPKDFLKIDLSEVKGHIYLENKWIEITANNVEMMLEKKEEKNK